MDASFRFTKQDIKHVINSAKTLTLLAAAGGGKVAMRTHANMFNLLEENACAFRNVPEMQGGFVVYYGNEFGIEHFMKPWVSCALTVGCMVPDTTPERYYDCDKFGPVYHGCHRFDQSMLSILIYRLFFNSVKEHTIYPGKFYFCRNCF